MFRQLLSSFYLSSNFGMCDICRVISLYGVRVFSSERRSMEIYIQWENFEFLLRCPYSQAYFTLSIDSDISGAGHPRFSPEE